MHVCGAPSILVAQGNGRHGYQVYCGLVAMQVIKMKVSTGGPEVVEANCLEYVWRAS